jgi:hexosaminidase
MLQCFKYSFSILLLLCLTSLIQSCEEEVSIDITKEDLLPLPNRVVSKIGSFKITADTPINILGDTEKLGPLVKFFNESISDATGFELESRVKSGASSGINFYLIDGGKEFSEAYTVAVVKDNIVVSSKNEAGLFYGIQTLLQLLPPEIHASTVQDQDWLVGVGEVQDGPEYAYRGAMLDVARHFFGVEDVKKVIDLVSSYKMNRLHLHLADDQGWRIEIKSWPKLTEIGGSTQVGGGEGGFYTQEEYKEIVDYAAERFVTIVPEIDMPGHTNAALASYPELNCNGKSPELYTGIEVGFSTFCTDKEITYKFVDDVIKELVAMTPGEYIHIGGDESHATKKEDYIYFFERVQKIVEKYGKKAIGWDEIATVEMLEGNVVQFWAGEENAKKGIQQGAKILMSPAKKAYLDMQYDSTSRLGLHWAAYIEADSAYQWNPVEYFKGLKQENILGIESPLWSETLETMEDIEYMLFPRLTAIAEIAWTDQSDRSWESYSRRLAKHSEVWDVKGINYYKSPKVDWEAREIEGLSEDK